MTKPLTEITTTAFGLSITCSTWEDEQLLQFGSLPAVNAMRVHGILGSFGVSRGVYIDNL